MTAAAGGTRAGRTQQAEGINAGVTIIPGHRELTYLLVGGNSSWFFIH
jgi:hypothetical protein